MKLRTTAALMFLTLLASPAALAAPQDEAKRIKDLERQVEDLRRTVEDMRKQQQSAPASHADFDRAIADLSARIEANTTRYKGGANVSAPGVESLKFRFEDRFRGEWYGNRLFGAPKAAAPGTPLFSNVSPFNPDGTGFNGPIAGGSTLYSGEATRLLNRLRISMDADVNKHLAGFFQLQYSSLFGTATGEPQGGSLLPNMPTNPTIAPVPPFPNSGGGNSPETNGANNSAMGFHQAYVVMKDIGDSGTDVTVGRFEIDIGNGRLVSSADWDNIGRSFDGVRVSWTSGSDFKITGFATKVVQGGLDFTYSDTNFLGAYADIKPADQVTITPYALFVDNNTTNSSVTPAPAAAVGKPITFGGLVDVKLDGGFKLDGEFALQIDNDRPPNLFNGQNGPVIPGVGQVDFGEAIAYAISGEYALPVDDYKPFVGLEFGEGSKLFNDLYASRHGTYGIADIITSWNNLSYWKMYGGMEVSKDFTLNGAFYIFHQKQGEDFGDGISRSQNIGQELDFWLKYRCSENITTQAGYAHFFNRYAFRDGAVTPGAAYATAIGQSNQLNEDADFVYLQLTVSF